MPVKVRSVSKRKKKKAGNSVQDKVGITILSHIAPAVPSIAFDTYWRFAVERQNIFFRRFSCQPQPWTEDPILAINKFTNAYRASDRVSQYLIRNVIYGEKPFTSPAETFFRTMLFKLFNKIETWEALKTAFGEITFEEYSFSRYSKVLEDIIGAGTSIYSAAYIMPSGGGILGHKRKHQNHLRLIEMMMRDDVPNKLSDTKRMHKGFELLLGYPTIGRFLAYQYITDINYSEMVDFSEMEFVTPGPGALDGIRKCFTSLGGLNESEIIRFMADIQEREFERLGLGFKSLWSRRLQLIDCQNLFCEVDKYSRVKHPELSGDSGRSRIKQKYRAGKPPIEYMYPGKWKINGLIEADLKNNKGQYVSQRISGRSIKV
jgi:hypothetical protein